MSKRTQDRAAKLKIWGLKLKKFMDALAQAKTEEEQEMLINYIDKTLMPESYDILGLTEAERRRIDEESEAAVDAQIAAEIEAFIEALILGARKPTPQ